MFKKAPKGLSKKEKMPLRKNCLGKFSFGCREQKYDLNLPKREINFSAKSKRQVKFFAIGQFLKKNSQKIWLLNPFKN